jgi:probable HAF family extracellular repeat protein
MTRSTRLVAIAWFATAVAAQALTFEPLGHTGGETSEPSAVSADGRVVVGRVFEEVYNGQGYGNVDVFRWQDGTMQAPLAGCSGYDPGVSDDGRTVAGYCQGASFRPAVWKDGALVQVSTDTTLTATEVSGDGNVVFGHWPHTITVPFGEDLNHIEAARLSGGVTPLGILPGDNWSEVIAVSRDGSVVGVQSQFRDHSGEEPVEIYQAARWKDGSLQDLGNLGAEGVFVTDVSSDGETIVGYLEYPSEGPVRAFRWTEATGMVDLGTPPGGDGARALGVSADGQVIVGSWGGPSTAGEQAMIWTAADGARDLQSLLVDDFGYDLGGWTLIWATAISGDALTVVGNGIDPSNGHTTGWIASLEGQLVVGLRAFDLDGNPLEGEISTDQTIDVELTLGNRTAATLGNLRFANGAPFVIDPRSPGGASIVSAPPPIPSSLGINETKILRYQLTTTARGLVGAHAKLTADGSDGFTYEDAHSLRMDIEDAGVLVEELRQYLLVLALDRALVQLQRKLQDRLRDVSRTAREKLAKILKPEKADKWLGRIEKFGTGLFEQAQGALTGMPPEAVDVRLPDEDYRGHTVEELNDAYNETFFDEVGKGVSKYIDKWGTLGGKAKRGAKAAWTDSINTSAWVMGFGTPEQRREWAARAVQRADQIDATNGVFQEYERQFVQAVNGAVRDPDVVIDATANKAVELTDAALARLDVWIAADARARNNLLKIADKDPVRFQREWAKLDAQLVNGFMPVVLDTLVGGAASRGVGGASKLVAKGRGGAVIEAGKAAGVLDESGAVTRASAIDVVDSTLPAGARATDVARTSEEFLSNVDGATVLQSSDLGNVYELPNLGGVPEITLDEKAKILSQLEREYAGVRGQDIKLVEVLKPSSALRKDGGIAKLELTEQKTGKPSMLDAGMPPEALGEACVWRHPTHPSARPGFNDLPATRKAQQIDDWNAANANWEAWLNPPAGSKTARLKECLGRESRVPLDPAPDTDSGLQRFVTAEFEEVAVQHGTAEARLIRVKKYDVEVVDTRSGRVVNTRTVVARSDRALPQTPDADAVAVGKVVGTDAQGRPIIEPLNREEREFIMQRYIDKNVKARRNGRIPDAAEHGVTLVMDDAGAAAAGKLLPKYGAPFLPEAVGEAYLRRIAPFVKPQNKSVEEMVALMKELVEGEGGFGQKAVVVTSDSRYFGELQVSQW